MKQDSRPGKGGKKPQAGKAHTGELKMPRKFALKTPQNQDEKPAKRTVTKTSKVFMFDEDNKPKRTRIRKEEIVVNDRKTGRFKSEKPSGGKRSYSNREESSFKPSKRFGSDEKKPFKSDKPSGAKRSYGSREEGSFKPSKRFGSDEKKPFKSDKPSGAKRSYGSREEGSFKPSKRFGSDDARSFKKKEYDPSSRENKPAKKQTYKTSRSFTKNKEMRAGEKNDLKKEEHKKTKAYDVKEKKPGKKTTSKTKEDDGLIRLNRYIANAGVCSRREADTLIEQGLVSVNGKVITEVGTKVRREDVVKYNGARLRPEALVYILLNKPKDYITTTEDEKGRKTVMDLVADASSERLFPIGRLDRNTTGVLLLTNDGDAAQVMTHPRFQIKKIYHAVLDKKVSGDDLNRLVEGVPLEDGLVKADAVAYVEKDDKRHIGIEIHSGRNRVVRRMFEHLGYEVEKLDRVAFGEFTKKNVERGRYRFLNDREIAALLRLKKKL